jgi:tight adherence protein B
VTAAAVLVVVALLVRPGAPGVPVMAARGRRALDRGSTWAARRLRRGVGGTDTRVVELLDDLGAALRAGLTPAEALRACLVVDRGGWRSTVLAPVLAAAEQGGPAGAVWERVARHEQHPEIAALARAWGLSERLGCPLAEAVCSTAASSRARTQLRQRLDTATAGARATSTLLSVLPVLGALAALTLGLGPEQMYGTLLGALSLGSGLVMLLVGRWLVARMMRGVVREIA